MNQVEFLLRLSENAQEQGDQLAARHHAERAAHAKEVGELYRMLELAMQNLNAEMHRWGMIQAKSLPVGQKPGGDNASQGRIVPRDDQREHPRAVSPR